MTSTSSEAGAWIPTWSFGDKARKIRRARNLTQAEFAQILNVGEKAASSWEVSDRTPRDIVAIAKRIEMAFGVPASWVLGLDDGGSTPPPVTDPAVAVPGVPSTARYLELRVA